MGRIIKRRIDVKKSYEEQLEELQKEMDLLNFLIPLRNYFLKIKKCQNSFVVEMRRVVAEELFALGLNKSEVGKVFGKDHSTIIHLKKLVSDQYVQKHVNMYYKEWISNNVYPVSISKSVPSYLHKTGWKIVRTYKLESVNDEN
jgi:predicted RNA-binding protein YlqC (UPF0109 family)